MPASPFSRNIALGPLAPFLQGEDGDDDDDDNELDDESYKRIEKSEIVVYSDEERRDRAAAGRTDLRADGGAIVTAPVLCFNSRLTNVTLLPLRVSLARMLRKTTT